jgi:hypothetical protein
MKALVEILISMTAGLGGFGLAFVIHPYLPF